MAKNAQEWDSWREMIKNSNRIKSRLIETQPSKTATGTATYRAIAAKERSEEKIGQDFLAEIFLPKDRELLFQLSEGRDWMKKITPGVYEYIISRTAYFDHVFKKAIEENYPQIVFLGAGYDTRSFRFKEFIMDTKIFELDIHTTQQHKKECLEKANIFAPDQMVFVPIDFEEDNLKDILVSAGYGTNQKTLFIWEGVTYYLQPETVDATLDFVKSNATPGSRIAFDYLCISANMLSADGDKEETVREQSPNSDEPFLFGIEDGKIDVFLSERGFDIKEHDMPEDLERKYLYASDGSFLGNMVDNMRIVQALVD